MVVNRIGRKMLCLFVGCSFVATSCGNGVDVSNDWSGVDGVLVASIGDDRYIVGVDADRRTVDILEELKDEPESSPGVVHAPYSWPRRGDRIGLALPRDDGMSWELRDVDVADRKAATLGRHSRMTEPEFDGTTFAGVSPVEAYNQIVTSPAGDPASRHVVDVQVGIADLAVSMGAISVVGHEDSAGTVLVTVDADRRVRRQVIAANALAGSIAVRDDVVIVPLANVIPEGVAPFARADFPADRRVGIVRSGTISMVDVDSQPWSSVIVDSEVAAVVTSAGGSYDLKVIDTRTAAVIRSSSIGTSQVLGVFASGRTVVALMETAAVFIDVDSGDTKHVELPGKTATTWSGTATS